MQLQSAVGLLSVLSTPEPPAGGADGYASAYGAYLESFAACRTERAQCITLVKEALATLGLEAGKMAGLAGAAGVGTAETVYSWVPDVAAVRQQVVSGTRAAGVAGVGLAAGAASVAAGAERVRSVAETVLADVKECASAPVECVRGQHYERNRRRREARKREKADAYLMSFAEKEAAQSLAERRVAENKVAVAIAKHKLVGLADPAKTKVVGDLAAARFEERINTSKARSQASFKKCDASLKSLGSTGSAGEFALRREAKKADDYRVKVEHLEKQLDIFARNASPEVCARVSELEEPVFQSSRDLFGECPADYTADEAESYYLGLEQDDMECRLF